MKLALSLLVALSAFGFEFRDPVPLTEVRLGIVPAQQSRLASNGTKTYLFWTGTGALHVTPVDGVLRPGRAIFETQSAEFDVVWTGEHFLVVAQSGGTLHGLFLDRDARPIGPDFVIATEAARPRLAVRGDTVLMLLRDYQSGVAPLMAQALTLRGEFKTMRVQLLSEPYSGEVVGSGDGFIALVDGRGGMRRALFDEEGALLSNVPLPVLPYTFEAMATNGEQTFVATGDSSSTTAALLDRNGTVLAISSSPTLGYRDCGATWTGSDFVLACSSRDAMTIQHFDSTARIVSEEIGPNRTDASYRPSLIQHAARTLIAWQRDVQGVIVTPIPLDTAPPLAASYGAPTQSLFGIATSNDALLVSWLEVLDGVQSIRIGLRD
ncbi:MAG TPA: hypothetical protein VF608_14280, partial [Thermoanaerobaculia bacterium]